MTLLVHEKVLTNRIFLETGDREFKFIARSGLYFGFPFGLAEMIVWIFWQPFWLLPVVGLTVGDINYIRLEQTMAERLFERTPADVHADESPALRPRGGARLKRHHL